MKKITRAFGVLSCVFGILFLIVSFICDLGFFSLLLSLFIIFFSIVVIKRPEIRPGQRKREECETGPCPSGAPRAVEKNVFSFNVAGVSYRQKDILDLCMENDDYFLPKRDLIGFGLIDEPIYKYAPEFGRVTLVPDPENEYDKSAIKVLRRDILLGYVPQEKCPSVHQIIDGDYAATAEAYAGPYKLVREEWDDDKADYTYAIENVDQNIGLKVTVTCK